jgi:uncharacterized surface anchored protein
MSGFSVRSFTSKLPRARTRLLALVSAFVVLAVVAGSALAVLVGSPSNFESNDGNMIVNTTGNNDWASVDFVHVTDAAAVTSDNSFTPGQKQDTACPSIEGHKNPPKDDFTDVASFSETNATTGDTYLYGATIRYTANGNASENIELKQSDTLCPGQPAGGLTVRTAGDKLIAIDYLNGGTNVVFHVLTWVTSGACFVANDPNPCWGATVITLSAAGAEGLASQAAITAANNPINHKALVAGQFAEFGVNLALAGIIPSGTCKAFPQTVWESRSSGSSFVSSTKDITIENQTISNCASVSVRKVGSDGGSQEGAVFTLYNGTGTGGTVVGTCTVDANGDCVDANGDNPFVDLNPGTYTLDETNTPAGYTKDTNLPFTFTLAVGDAASYEFTDVAQTGAIVISKTAKHADPNSSPDLAAGFTVTDSNGGTHSVSTDANGSGCVDGLPPGSATVSETSPPAGYNPDDDQTVTVVAGTTCTDGNGVVASFVNIPLTDITVSVDSQVDGGTSSVITCDDPDASTATTGANGDGSLNVTDLEPGLITCTIDIDP